MVTFNMCGGVAVDDFDGDGVLDIVTSTWDLRSDLILFRGTGGEEYAERSAAAGFAGITGGLNLNHADYDGDGDLDVLVLRGAWLGAAGKHPPSLLANDGRGHFVDVTFAAGVTGKENYPGQGADWADYDNDGDLDLYLGHETQPTVEAPCQLFRNDGDGWLDFYLGTGYPGYDGLVPNVMYWNDRGQRFLDVTTAGGFGHVQKGHGIAFADLDADVDVDVFSQLGGAFPGDAFANAVYRNPGFDHRWLEISLVGVRSNRFGIGAHLRLDVRQGDALRSIHRWMDTGASFGSNPLRLHVGLGRAEALERLEVYWPTSDTTQVFEDLPLDASVVVTEGQDELRLGLR